MKLSAFKKILENLPSIRFELPNGQFVPVHFHITEIGQTDKHFIDCGGTVRRERKISFQLWEANDLDHRLAPQKLKDIIALSERSLALVDAEIEVEYQGETIGVYGLEPKNDHLLLTSKHTACLASDQCGVPKEKQKIKLSELPTGANACCTPGGGCC